MSQRVSIRKTLRNPEQYTDDALDAVHQAEAKAVWQALRVEYGLRPTTPNLMPPGATNAKLAKTPNTYGLSLSPHSLAGVGTVCPWAGQCKDPCINTAGQWATRDHVQTGRIVRTVFLARHPYMFRALLREEIRRAAHRHGPDVFHLRLNVFSDLLWHEEPWLQVPNLPATARPYGYSKNPDRGNYDRAAAAGHVLTYSVNERDHQAADIADLLAAGHRAAVVLAHGEPWPTGAPFPLTDGDAHDLRAGDPPGSVAVLRAKGKGKQLRPDPDGRSFVKAATWFAP